MASPNMEMATMAKANTMGRLQSDFTHLNNARIEDSNGFD